MTMTKYFYNVTYRFKNQNHRWTHNESTVFGMDHRPLDDQEIIQILMKVENTQLVLLDSVDEVKEHASN